MSSNPDPDELDDLVGRIAGEFTDRVHRGERPDVEEYTSRFPAVAGVLREVLPAVRALGTLSDPLVRLPSPDQPPQRVADYIVEREIGRGGMGVVYLARDERLDRVVALKVLRSAEEDRERFLLEGRAAARLRHEHIVQVYEVGESDGRPFLALEYVPDGSLADYLLQCRTLPAPDAAFLIERVAAAIHSAHESGIVHRDLKPGNILLSRSRNGSRNGGSKSYAPSNPGNIGQVLVPKVTDFGLAKQLGSQDGDRTRTGAIIGTPGYMAPEQAGAGGRLVGPGADIYALGAVLYQCLTGKPPFDGKSTLEVLERVRTAEPVPLRRLDPAIPRDLETICLKCLRKEPHERYATAADLAEDLRRHREGRTIVARPVGRTERAVKWIRRRPTVAAVYALFALAVILAGLGGGATWLWRSAESAREQAVKSGNEADQHRERAELARAREAELRAELDRLHNIRQIDLAYRDWLTGDLGAGLVRLRHVVGASNLGWEWGYVHHLYHGGYSQPVVPDRGLAQGVTLSPDGRYLAIRWGRRPGASDLVMLWDLSQSATEPVARLEPKSRVSAIAFSPHGGSICLGTISGNVEHWDITGKLVNSRALTDQPILGLAVDPEGQRVATSGLKDQRVSIWSWPDGQMVRRFDATAGVRGAFAFSPDWSRCAATVPDNQVKVWDTATGTEVVALSNLPSVGGLAFDPSGRLLAGSSHGDRRVWVREIPGGSDVFGLRASLQTPRPSFDAGGRLIVADGPVVQAVDVRSGAQVRLFNGATGPATLMAAAGDHVVAIEGFTRPFVWDTDSDPQRRTFQTVAESNEIAFRPGTADLAVCRADKRVTIWDATTGKAVRHFDDHPANVSLVTFSPHGRLLAVGCFDGTVRVWDVATGTAHCTLPRPADGVSGLAFNPDGQTLAVGTYDRTVQVWDLQSSSVRWSRTGLTSPVVTLDFTSDGNLAGAAGDWTHTPSEGSLYLWNGATGEELSAVSSPELIHRDIKFAPDGKTLYTVAVSRPVIEAWDRQTGQRVRAVPGLRLPANRLTFHPDGSRLVTAEPDGQIRLWDVASGEECLSLRLSGSDMPWRLAFSQDGRRLAVACKSGAVHVFDSPPYSPNNPSAVREPGSVPPIHGGQRIRDPH